MNTGATETPTSKSESSAEKSETRKEEPELSIASEQFPIERYKPIAKLGHGASGTVYLSRDRLLKKKVGVKVLNHLSGEQLIAFQNEAKLTSKLKHPNIIQVLDFGPTPSGFPYMVLEYSDRVISLSTSLQENGPLDVRVAIDVFSKIADALEYAHSMRIFHRDLKPSNTLFTYADKSDISVKLIDFGVAFMRKESLEPTRTDVTTIIVGTVGYMAPELANDKQYDVRCEIYSLGCMLFESLTGRLPFVADSPMEMLAMHTRQIAPPLSAVAGKTFPIQMERLVADCLAKDPDARPASAAIFKNRLQRCLISMEAKSTAPFNAIETAGKKLKLSESSSEQKKLTGKFLAVAALSIVAVLGIVWIAFSSITKTERTIQPNLLSPPAVQVPRKLADQLYGTELEIKDTNLTELTIPSNAPEITSVRISKCTIKDPSVLLNLQSFPRLKNLSIDNSTGLNKLAMMKLTAGLIRIASGKLAFKAKNRLEKPLFINFSNTDIETSALIELQVIPSVAALSLADTKMDDGVVECITPHKMLQAVDLSGTNITETALEKLSRMKSLLLIRAYNCPALKKFQSKVIDHTSILVEKSQTDIDDEFPIYFQAAQQDNVTAQANLASLYYSGKGVDRNFDEAYKWYEKAALAGSASSQVTVGTFYKLGLVGGGPDPKKALKWYHMAESNGQKLKASRQIGEVYESLADVTPGNKKLAIKYYKVAADAGDRLAQAKLADLYSSGFLGTENYEESFKWWQKAAASGDGYALYSLGFCYLVGQGVKADDSMAFKYFSRSAAAGDAVGMYNLGCMYLNGKGTSVDLRRAMTWFRKSSDKGYSEASTSVGFLFDRGIGVERDYKEALKYYKIAGENGNALLAIGDLYRDGKGVATDASVANSFYRRAANLGNEQAKARLGL